MHSNGHGEPGRPAGGTPWGAPPAQDQQPPAEAADATQMLPPFPAAGPASAPPPMPPGPPPGPVPFAAGAPQPGPVPYAEPPAQPQAQQQPQPELHPQPGPVPFAEATQMLPPYPGAQPQAAEPGVPEVAEATQALPLYQEQPQGYDEYGRPLPPAQPQQYGGEQQFADPAGYEQPAPAAPDSDYDHLFRNDVPGPEQMRPRLLQPHAQEPQQWQQQPGYGGGNGYDGYDGYDDGDGDRRKMSPKVLIGIVVAGCVVAGLVVGALMNSGDKANADNSAGASPSASPSASSKAPAAGGDKKDVGADSAEAQAKALDTLLASSNASRSSVVNAVESIKNCKNLPAAASDLRAAATERDGLVTKLGKLSVDKLPDHERLTTALTKAWQASSAADGHYAKWADQAAHNHSVCKNGHARTTNETRAGNRESGTATTQKKTAVKLWNSIAAKYDLTKRQYSQL